MKTIVTSMVMALATVGSVSAQSLPEGYEPRAVSNFHGQWIQEDEKNYIQMWFTTPTEAICYNSAKQDYDTISIDCDLTKVVVMRSEYDQYAYRSIYTFEAPEKGVELTYIDKGTNNKGLTYGRYDYKIVVYVGDVTNYAWNWDALKSFPVGQVPADIETVTSTVDGNAISISFVAPALSNEGDEMTMPMNVTVSEMDDSWPPQYTTITNFENAEPGQTYTTQINNARNGVHTYSVKANTETGENHETCIVVFVGTDQPGRVRNASAVLTESGIHIDWDAPVIGMHNGDMGNPSELTYSIYRKRGAYDAGTRIANMIAETEFIDNVDTDVEATYLYEIYAQNSIGESYASITNTVLTGSANPLPYTENFDSRDTYGGMTFDHVWLKDYSGNFSTWYTAGSMDLYGNVTPHNGSGLAYAMYSSWGRTEKYDALISGYVDFEGANDPTVSIWVYDIANGGSDVTLKIQASTDGGATFTDIISEQMGNASSRGWRELSASMSDFIGKDDVQICIRTVADGTNCHAIIIDELKIEDNENPETSIKEVSVMQSNKTFNLQGQSVSAPQEGIFVVGGKKVIIK